MWNRVEEVVDDIRPLIRSVGVDAKVVDVIDRVVTVELSDISVSEGVTSSTLWGCIKQNYPSPIFTCIKTSNRR